MKLANWVKWLVLVLVLPITANGADDFKKVTPGRSFSFPQDHNIHPGYQSEWWYVTANLKGEDGFTYGAQFTLFANTLLTADQPQRIFFAHAALSTPTEFFHAERYAKASMGHGGIEAKPWQVFLDHWQLKGTGLNPLPGTLTVREPKFAYNLKLSESPLFLQGDKGFSKKDVSGTNASYYYNAPFIKLSGDIQFNGKTVKVTGEAWFDREWSSGMFTSKGLSGARPQTMMKSIGWDWLALHLDDKTALMLYRVRSETETYLDGVLMYANGEKQQLSADEIDWQPIDYESFGEHKYPIGWRLKVPTKQIDITIEAINRRQLMDGTIPYWEGAVKTSGSHSAWGYLELFGY
jgi:predicted secreted hydrolase